MTLNWIWWLFYWKNCKYCQNCSKLPWSTKNWACFSESALQRSALTLKHILSDSMLRISYFVQHSNAFLGPPHLRVVFYRMGLTDKDIVALSGGHTLVLYHMDLNLDTDIFLRMNAFVLKFLFCVSCCREEHIQRDLALRALGLKSLWNLTTHTLCKISIIMNLFYISPLLKENFHDCLPKW